MGLVQIQFDSHALFFAHLCTLLAFLCSGSENTPKDCKTQR